MTVRSKILSYLKRCTCPRSSEQICGKRINRNTARRELMEMRRDGLLSYVKSAGYALTRAGRREASNLL